VFEKVSALVCAVYKYTVYNSSTSKTSTPTMTGTQRCVKN